MRKDEYILCAAIHFKDGKIHEHQPDNIESGFVITGRRHHNCYMSLHILNIPHIYPETRIDGFLTSYDRFLNREEAGKFAFEAGQIDKPTDCLFSEDLYLKPESTFYDK